MDEFEEYKQLLEQGTSSPEFEKQRISLAELAAQTFLVIGRALHVSGHIIGEERKNGESPFGHGNDEAVGVATLLQMASHLISASANLLTSGNPYAGSALLRQIVEIEYLAWAFAARSDDAKRWLRSDKQTRMNIFAPRKLREAAGEQFRGKDYIYHCEFGGHPTPVGRQLLKDEHATNQLLLSDLLGHVAGIWNHFVDWAKRHEETMVIFAEYQVTLPTEIKSWYATDPLVGLPAPP